MRRLGLAPVLLAFACNGDPVESTTDTSTSSSDPTTTAAPEPVCCGYQCVDPLWSCSREPCLFPTAPPRSRPSRLPRRAHPRFSYAIGDGMKAVQAAESRH